MNKHKTGMKVLLFAVCAGMAAGACISSYAAVPSSAAVSYMPGVTDSMSWPDYWLSNLTAAVIPYLMQ